MSYVDRVISELLRDTGSREVSDLLVLLKVMSNDVVRGNIDEEGVKRFLSRNKRFLQHILSSYASRDVSVEEFIERLVDAVMLDAVTAPGRSILQMYVASQRRGGGESEERKQEKKTELL